MMRRFMPFREIRLNPGMRDLGDIEDIADIGECRWAKPTCHAAITHGHPTPWTSISVVIDLSKKLRLNLVSYFEMGDFT
jgi:hypothetical protein